MTVSTLSEDDQLVQDMHYRIRAINNMDDDVKSSLIDFKVDDVKLGKVSKQERPSSVTQIYK